MSNTLRPPSSINDLRTQAHMLLSARLQNLDLTALLIAAVKNVPSSILPYLIWQYDMSIPAPAMEHFGLTEVQIVQQALPSHQYLGSVQTLLDILTLCGYAGSTVMEGQNSWGGSGYPPSQGWALFRVVLTSGGAPTHTDLQYLTQLINFFKPARCLLDQIVVTTGYLFADDEIPAGAMDGSNKVYTLANPPLPPTSLKLYYNGSLLTNTVDYTIDGNTITLINLAPNSADDDSLIAYYLYSVAPSGFLTQQPFGTINGTNKTFTLTIAPNVPQSLQLYYNGYLLRYGIDYTLSGTTINLTLIAPSGTDVLNAYYRYGAVPLTPHYADNETPGGTIDGSNKVFTLVHAPNAAKSLQLFRNASLMAYGIDYTLSGTNITYTTAPIIGDSHVAYYRY